MSANRDEPTTAQVRSKYATVLDDCQGWRYSPEWGLDFDRWLSRIKAEAAAEALEDAAKRNPHALTLARGWLRSEAARIRRDAGLGGDDS